MHHFDVPIKTSSAYSPTIRTYSFTIFTAQFTAHFEVKGLLQGDEPEADVAANQTALEQWRAWWEANSSRLFENR